MPSPLHPYSLSGTTSPSLIDRAKTGDGEAWTILAELYGPLVYRWARQKGLQESDAADVMQNVFRNVARSLRTFEKQHPGDSFRAWLRTITENELRRFFQQLNKIPLQLAESAWDVCLFAETSASDASNRSNPQLIMVRQALELVRRETQERTWKAFWQVTAMERTAAEVGLELGMSEKAVRQAKYRVLCRLREILLAVD
jgi:RNA polymerase sigma-70 factor (ECF subfamily)